MSQQEVPVVAEQVRTSIKAIVSLVLGILALCTTFITGLPAIVLGVWSLIDINRRQGALGGTTFATIGVVLGGIGTVITPCLVAILLPAVASVREVARMQKAEVNLRQIGLATVNFEQASGTLPVAGEDEQGNRPLLSWRVHLLPHLGYDALYDQFHLDEPWDSLHNQSLIDLMPDCYQNPGYELAPGMTAMLAVTGPETAFPGGERGLPISALVGGTFQTILFVEVDADQAVVWTSPDDWQFDPDDPFRGLGGARPGGKFLAATADTAVFKYDVDLPEESIVPMFTRADDAVMPMPKF